MATYSIEAAEAQLDELIDRVLAGENIEIETPYGSRVRLAALSEDEIARLGREPGQ